MLTFPLLVVVLALVEAEEVLALKVEAVEVAEDPLKTGKILTIVFTI